MSELRTYKYKCSYLQNSVLNEEDTSENLSARKTDGISESAITFVFIVVKCVMRDASDRAVMRQKCDARCDARKKREKRQ